jgi:2-phospho-L-lactate guanylyltransferase
MEHGAPELNLALTRATIVAQKAVTGGVLVIPADLPLIEPEDIQALIERAVDPPVIVIAPDRRREGTNALLVNPAGLIDYHFGPGSFDIHCKRAEQTCARLEIFELPSLALDVDYPEDLELVSDKLESMNLPLFESLEV